jgi:short-subunit dehydrogenase
MPSSSAPGLAIVTGASTGIGRALAQEFAEHGFDVVLAADEPQVQVTAAEVARAGISVTAVEADLSTPDGVEAVHRHALEQHAPVTAVALNAAVGVHGPFHRSRLEDDLRLIDLNVRSVVHLAKLLIPGMVDRGNGRVLMTSSIAAQAPGPFHATYAASKAFVHSLAEALRHELRGTGVTVTSLLPGPTDTAFFERAGMEETRIARGPKDSPDKVARQAFDALMAGKDHVVAGSLVNRAGSTAAALVPDPILAAVAARATTPIDKEKL